MNKKELKEALDFSLTLAKDAGVILLKYQKRLDKLKITNKEAQGVASTADLKSEEFIIKNIVKKYPNHFILAEESAFKKYGNEKSALNAFKKYEWSWVIDPLDGTNNYLNGLDYYAVCISLVNFGKPVLGVVYRPTSGECFYAVKSNKTKVKNLIKNTKAKTLYKEYNTKKLSQSMLATGFVSEKGAAFTREFNQFKHMMFSSRGIRRMGSAALDLCLVANGTFDGFWERGLAPWDMAAAGFICEQAGVSLSEYNGGEYHPFAQTILAARRPLFQEVKKQFK